MMETIDSFGFRCSNILDLLKKIWRDEAEFVFLCWIIWGVSFSDGLLDMSRK